MKLLASFIAENFKKSLEQIQSYEDASFWAQNCQFAPKKLFSETPLIIKFL